MIEFGMTYIGSGNLKLRANKSVFSSKFRVGFHGSPSACVYKYAELARKDELLAESLHLLSDIAICDCEEGTPCHAEVLAYMKYMRHQEMLQDPGLVIEDLPRVEANEVLRCL